MTGLPDRVADALARVNAVNAAAGRTPKVRAVVVLGDDDRRLGTCLQYAAERGYGVAVAEARVALAMVLGGTADVIVAATDADLPYLEIAGVGDRRRPAAAGAESYAPRQRRPQSTEATPGILRRPQPRPRGPFGD